MGYPHAPHARETVVLSKYFGDREATTLDGWRKRGYTLDLGIGFAHGYATLGAIGFAGRQDYAAIGSVTNLATRLCGEAKGGEMLTNQKTLARIEDQFDAEALGPRSLKGFTQPVDLFRILSSKSPA